MAGWLVGKSDFNENPVVSLDLDLDFGLRLRVCQYAAEINCCVGFEMLTTVAVGSIG